MNYTLDLSGVTKKEIYDLNENFSGSNSLGDTFAFNNYYLQKNGKPYFGISGELHFSRVSEKRWRDELIKAKMGGIRVISTYVIWIHHEEEEGVFNFTGNCDIRRFVSLCQELGLYVILRVGPFAHGEVRNGGLPDWLYGKPFEVRTLNEEFLSYTRIWYEQIAKQVEGLFFKDNGPIIGVQIDNEYMHSSAPWEMTTGISNEWVYPGDGGNEYMLKLKEIAAESGLLPAFYTCTAWGGAMAPDTLMPLWGGYSFRPWIFYKKSSERKAHPATEEYRYQDFHKNGVVCTNDFKPNYLPETRPYACCEMGGGMMCSYDYRFLFDYKSVDAMANIKMASGCNFLGYYMYHGGTNPLGKYGVFMNENQVEKRSYDYQAAIGEYGQLRESYRRLKSMHLFATTFEDRLCGLQTVLPQGASDISPTDPETLRFAVRTDGARGFLFLNNYQDHFALPQRTDDSVTLCLREEKLEIPVCLAGEENAILPFHFDLDGIDLVMATAQPITKTMVDGIPCYVFFVPDGMEGRFVFEKSVNVAEMTTEQTITEKEEPVDDKESTQAASMEWLTADDSTIVVSIDPGTEVAEFIVEQGEKKVKLLVLDRELSNQMYLLSDGTLVFTDETLLEDEQGLRLETRSSENMIYTYPKNAFEKFGGNIKKCQEYDETDKNVDGKMQVSETLEKLFGEVGVLGCYEVKTEKIDLEAKLQHVINSRYTVEIPDISELSAKEVMLQVTYRGDIGNAFLGNTMIHDNFYHGAVWEFGLSEYADWLKEQPMVLAITPKKEGARVNAESSMAARREEADAIIGKVEKVELVPVYEIKIR